MMRRDLVSRMRSLDFLVRIREDAWRIEATVESVGKRLSGNFYHWLIEQGILDGSAILSEMAWSYADYVYLSLTGARRRPTLANINKPQLKEFIAVIEFAVPLKLWNAGINHFDGLLMLYQFLDSIGYETDLNRIERAINAIRASIIKFPVSDVDAAAMENCH